MMKRSLVLVAAAAGLVHLGGCKGAPAPLPKPSAPDGDDPWASAPAADRPAAPAAAGLGGFGDPMALVRNVVENLQHPGPYEAPDSSPGFVASAPHLGVMTIGGRFAELESFSWTGGDDAIVVRGFGERLAALAGDDALTGLLLRVDDVEASLPDLVELRAAMATWRAAGKHLYCHAESASNAGYLFLAGCEKVALAPTGQITLSGPSAMPVHLKGLLDRLGVTADFLHVGAYKGAAEPLTRDRPSKEMEEVLGAILDQHYRTMVDMVVASRPALTADGVAAIIDHALLSADEALTAGLVDEIATFEQFVEHLAQPWTRVPLEAKPDGSAGMMKLAQFFGAVPSLRPTGDHVALVYAVGDVVDGGGDGIIGARAEIASRTLVPVLRVLAADPAVKAVVVRIDSGGGSALASEQIWHAMTELKQRKPVVVSMSDVAASGGYYIAAGATKIFAQPDTLTGSIGVVGGKLAPGAALAKVGVTTFPMGRGKRATMFASLGPWTADERAAVQASMDSIYGVFLDRVAAGRNLPRPALEAVAAGRVWTGTQAKANGLVDELGGLNEALASARALGQVDASTALEVYPPTITLRDVIGRIGDVDVGALGGVSAQRALIEAAALTSPAVAEIVEHTLAQLARFADERVQAVAILPVVFR